jgi:hypothetical protein
MKSLIVAALTTFLVTPTLAAGPVVLELYTSQSCSSCPPADALLQSLSQDPQLLALSFHIDYWDGAGWRDPYSRPESTARQRTYASVLPGGVYTPELVVDGQSAMIGSRENEVRAAIVTGRTRPKPLDIAITPAGKQQLAISISGKKPAGVTAADIWLITYNPRAVTSVRGGENRGETLTSINNVTAIAHLGQLGDQPQNLQAAMSNDPGDKYAVLVQLPNGGPILGAGAL